MDDDSPRIERTLGGPVSRRLLLKGGAASLAAVSLPRVPDALASPATAHRIIATAPEGGVQAVIDVDAGGRATWWISVDGRRVLAPSPLGFTLDDGTDFTSGLSVVNVGSDRRVTEQYTLRQSKVSDVRSPGTMRTVTLSNAAGKRLYVDLWVSEQGAAARYRSDAGSSTRLVTSEATALALNVPADGGAQFLLGYTKGVTDYQEFYIQRDQHQIAKLGDPVRSEIDATTGIDFPLLARTCDDVGETWWVLASESGFDASYPGCHLSQPVTDTASNTVSFSIAYPTDDEALGTFGPGAPQVSGRWQSPWRFVAIGRTAGEVAETTLATDLAEPSKVADAGWVHPGGASWGWLTNHSSAMSLEQTLPFFDLAQQIGWPYSLVDAKWDQMTDSTGAAVPLERLVSEADKRGIKLFLWYNSGGTNNNATANTPRDRLVDPATRRQEMQRLSSLGVAGMKVDGWQSDKQELLALQRDVVEDAARYKLHIVLHNTSIPRGWDRTYPHLLGWEAGVASEYYANAKPYSDQMPEQATIAAVARNAIGPFDYGTTLLRSYVTQGCNRLTSIAHEIALTVIYQSGFNGYADSLDQYTAQPAAVQKYLRTVPLNWDETRFLSAEPGRQVVVARRKGHTWWVAGINGLTKTISPGLDTTAAGYTPATGQSITLQADLRKLGISPGAKIELFADTSATDNTLAQRATRGNHISVDTAPFGGFVAVVSQ